MDAVLDATPSARPRLLLSGAPSPHSGLPGVSAEEGGGGGRPSAQPSRLGVTTHVPGVLPLHRALALLLLEQGHLLGLQPGDGLRPVVLGVKVHLPDLGAGGGEQPIARLVRAWQSLPDPDSALDS